MTSTSGSPQTICAVTGDAGGLLGRIEDLRRRSRERVEAEAGPSTICEHATAHLSHVADEESRPVVLETPPTTLLHKSSRGDQQSDFFVPALYDLGTRDSRSIMDVAVYRLSKKEKRVGEMIHYDLPDGYVEVSAGAHGMASVWDYDIVLMMVSHLTEAMNRYRKGKGEKPGRMFRPHVSDILKFAHRGDGSRQVEEVEAALDRLRGTTIKTVREKGKLHTTEAEGLIARYRVLSRTDTKRISSVEIEVPEWVFREVAVADGNRPGVLTVHPDYFLIKQGIGRYLYRLARRAAGCTEAKWNFATIYERSGSTGTLKKFTEKLQKIIAANDLPEYDLRKEYGQSGPQLVMTHRSARPVPPGP
jgi:plasmid replication initiation protein